MNVGGIIMTRDLTIAMTPSQTLYALLDERSLLLETHYQKGDLILRPDNDQGRCYFIKKGLVKVYHMNYDGEEEMQLIYDQGCMFPLSWILGTPNFDSYFEAMSECDIAYVSQETLRDLIDSDIQASNAALHRVMAQFSMYAGRINSLAYKYSRERLAYHLLLVGFRFGRKTIPAGAIELPAINQQEIGASVNMSRESVNRELSRLEKRGVIESRKNKLVILDRDTLRKELKDAPGALLFDS